MENLEWSLPVPSVQDLASQHLETVPTRYLREDMDGLITSTGLASDDSSLRVPLIDMSKLANPESQDIELKKLHAACKDWGIFQLINHGVSDELIRNMSKQVQEFFELPLIEKKRWKQKPGCLEGYGQAFVISEEQKLDWNDMIFLKTLPIQKRKHEFWPEKPPKFREYLDRYSQDIRQVAVGLTSFMAMGLEIEGQELCEAYQEGLYHTRMNCYPPCPQPEQVMGITPHADNSGITLLLECGNTPGLQVLKDGHWVFVEPIDGAIVVNTGHITEIISNGVYKAPDHRAVVNKSKDRLSIVTFCYPNSSFNVGPAKELINSRSPPLYNTLNVEEYFHSFYNRKLEVSFIDSLKI